MAVRYPEFRQLGTEILAISVDSVHDHKVWNETELSRMVEGGLPYPLLSDRNGAVGRLYGVYDSANGKDYRSTFWIDPQGFVQAAEGIVSQVGRSTTETLRLLKAHQLMLATGQAIPCDWQERGTTINPVVEEAGETWRRWQPESRH